MEALGGDCGVRGRSDGTQGSVFWFSFPYRPDTSFSRHESTLSLHISGTHTVNRPQATAIQTEFQTPEPGRSPALSPLPSPRSNALQVLAADALADNGSAKLGPLRILVTDDAPTILKVCKRMLTINGHDVDTAVNGNESLQKLKTKYVNRECDALVTDIQMPVMDGIECTKRFRVWEESQLSLIHI